nr:tyrosine-type recombinase/integrase [Lentilactobacillus kisonensis]
MNLNEAERVIKYLESNWSYEKVWDCWMMIALLTGMREAEIAGLTWDNIDFPHKQINVRQAWSQQHQDLSLKKTPGLTELLQLETPY